MSALDVLLSETIDINDVPKKYVSICEKVFSGILKNIDKYNTDDITALVSDLASDIIELTKKDTLSGLLKEAQLSELKKLIF